MLNDLYYWEHKLEKGLKLYEQQEKYEQALLQYKEVERGIKKILELNKEETERSYTLLAQCFLRQAGMLRQLNRFDEANEMNNKEIEAARLSKNSIAYAQSLLSTGVNFLSNGQIEKGLYLLDEAKSAFEEGDTLAHKQGVGWYWILQADLGNKGLINITNHRIIKYASNAIQLLTQIGNIPGVIRAYKARTLAYQNSGDLERASSDLESLKKYET